jgi:hypothetical protein
VKCGLVTVGLWGEIMIIKFEFPPNYAEIDAKFKLTVLKATVDLKPVFAFAPYCFNPYREHLGEEIMQHEATHILRQKGDPEGWWRKYLDDDQFRLLEEIPAHAIEYFTLARGKDRTERRRLFHHIASRLRHTMYGYVPALSYDSARSLLKKATKVMQDD